MGVRKYKPTSPGRRFQTVSDFADITTDKPCKSLLKPLRKTGGRNNRGRITVWQRGGGNRRAYRIIDFKRNKIGIPAKVETIEYDPNRSSRIALLKNSVIRRVGMSPCVYSYRKKISNRLSIPSASMDLLLLLMEKESGLR